MINAPCWREMPSEDKSSHPQVTTEAGTKEEITSTDRQKTKLNYRQPKLGGINRTLNNFPTLTYTKRACSRTANRNHSFFSTLTSTPEPSGRFFLAAEPPPCLCGHQHLAPRERFQGLSAQSAKIGNLNSGLGSELWSLVVTCFPF